MTKYETQLFAFSDTTLYLVITRLSFDVLLYNDEQYKYFSTNWWSRITSFCLLIKYTDSTR